MILNNQSLGTGIHRFATVALGTVTLSLFLASIAQGVLLLRDVLYDEIVHDKSWVADLRAACQKELGCKSVEVSRNTLLPEPGTRSWHYFGPQSIISVKVDKSISLATDTSISQVRSLARNAVLKITY